MEAFLSSNGVQYEHHDLATDEAARQDLAGRGIKAVPVTIVDDQAIIGYYPQKLVPALRLEVEVEPAGDATWLAQKYEIILGAAIRATRQLGATQLDQQVPWRPESLRQLILHILSFPELAWLSHGTGSMTVDDMKSSKERLKHLVDMDDIAEYGESVRRSVIGFLKSGNVEAYERVVPAHYGGEVTVIELLHIILRHSTHHLKQAYWFMENVLRLTPFDPAGDEDFDGISTPVELV